MLEDMVVLEVADVWTGPLAGLMLADFGATVIKVEPPEWKRPLEVRIAQRDDPLFLAGNRGKRSMVLDMTLPQGREIFARMATKADVVLSNFPPGVVRKLQLDYDTLGKVNPRLICCNVSGFGLKGKDIDRPAFELAIQAISGVMSVTGEEGRLPVRCGVSMADEKGGIFATLGILAAYISREKDGKGRQIDISMFDNLLLNFAFTAVDYFMTGRVPGPVGSGAPTNKRADYRCYATKDGYIVIASGRGDDKWRALCKTVGKEELGTDPQFDSYDKRIVEESRLKLEQVFEPILKTRTSSEWISLLSAVDIPCAPVNRLDQVLRDAEAQGRDMVISFPLPLGGTTKGIGNPVKVGTKENLTQPPRLGQHTVEVLKEMLDYSDEKISELAKAKVVFLGS